jgi:hypothetical protein
MATDKFNLDGFAVSDENVCTADGGFVGGITGSWILGTSNGYLADGAISLSDDISVLNSASASTAMTLADGIDGQRIVIAVISYTNTADVDASFVGTTATATFSATGESIELVWSSTANGWIIIGNNGALLS